MKKKNFFWMLWFLPFIPFVLAFIVFMNYYASQSGGFWFTKFVNAVYDSVRIYSMTIAESGDAVDTILDAANHFPGQRIWFHVFLEIARFGGFIVLGAAFYQLFRNSFLRMVTFIKGRSNRNYALYGDSSSINVLKEQLGSHALPLGNKERFHAKNHIVAFKEYNQTLAFLSENLPKMLSNEQNKVYVYTDVDIQSEHLNPQLIISNSAKNCARLYWEKEYLKADEKTAVFIGFDRYGQELLNHALQTHVFLEHRCIRYHVLGDDKNYLAQHAQIKEFLTLNESDENKDSLFFHSEAWFKQKNLIENADRVILCYDTDEENLLVLNEMRSANMRNGKKTDIRLSSSVLVKELWQLNDDQIHCFGTNEELYTLSLATNSELYAKGRLVHAYYYGSTNNMTPLECLKDKEFQHNWETTSHYNRCSSIAQDDHSGIKVRALLQDDKACLTEKNAHEAAKRYAQLSDEEKLPYLEMEHARWCRFLWMNGWSYAPVRDNAQRKHHLLVPFDQLPKKELFKDENAYVILKDAGMEERN